MPSRHGQQGGLWDGDGGGDDRGRLRRHGADAGSGGDRRDAAALGPGAQSPGGGSAAGAQGGEAPRPEDVAPRMGLPLPPTAPTSLHPLEGVGLQRREEAPTSRCAGGRRGQLVSTRHGRAGRGCPSRRHAAIGAWNAAAKGGTKSCHASRGKRGQSRHSVGRSGTAVNRQCAIAGASGYGRRSIP
jgi:hypothetical protein